MGNNESGMNRLCVIGAGAMGYSFASGVVSAGLLSKENVVITDIDENKLTTAANEIGVQTEINNDIAVKNADVILLAVKPGIIKHILAEIGDHLNENQLLISIAAGVRLELIESYLPDKIGAIRAMPNTSVMIGAGAIGFCRGKDTTDAQVEIANKIFEAVGICYEVDERMLDAVTGLSGSGPAYVYMMIEALSDGGLAVGLPRRIALRLAAQTVMGASRMVLEVGKHPAQLKDLVSSPGGTTIAGLEVLEKAGFRSALIEAVKAATKRAEELG